MTQKNRLAFNLAIVACVLAWCVVMLGAYTRLKDAGLGCPDWPGCYGQLIAPDTAARMLTAEKAFPGQAINETKAWTEMVHRYLAGTVGLLVFVIGILTLRNRKLLHQPIALPLFLMMFVIFQALLGKWTVTMRLLPPVVMLHLMGGMTVFVLLGLLAMMLSGAFEKHQRIEKRSYQPWAALGIVIVACQIMLGGWTSSNYAALICPDFPTCQGQIWPAMNFHGAFHFWMAIGVNYQGGVLGNSARVTIQMMHRLGGLVTLLYLSWFSCWVWLSTRSQVLKKLAKVILGLLLLQIALGISNVIWLLPLGTAVLHNGVAALLLFSLVAFNYAAYKQNAHVLR